jgi:hypothetical protein
MRYLVVAASLAFAFTVVGAPISAIAKDAPKLITSDGKCWLNTDAVPFKWGDCPGAKKSSKKKG